MKKNKEDQVKPKKKRRKRNRTVAEQLADNRTRAQKNRAKAQKDLRDKFRGNQYIIQLERCMKKYTALYKEISAVKMRKSAIHESPRRMSKKHQSELAAISVKLDCLKLQLDVIKGQVDLNFRRLKFVVPELRSMEFKPGDGNPFEQLGNTLASITQSVSD